MRPLIALLFLALAAAAAEPKPNIVLVLIDDLGCSDVGCFGSQFYETPNIDRLARDGMKFEQAYSACTVCSPTRGSLMTGKSPAALHLTDWIPGHERPFAKLTIPRWTQELPKEEETIAAALKKEGYVSAQIGKWHLGQALATDHGFDISIADNGKGQPASYISPYKNPRLPDGPPGEFLSDRLTDEAIKFIEQNKEKPFFLYLPHYAVHTPLGGKPGVIAKYKTKANPADPQHNPVYAALIESADDSVGRLRAKLGELKLAERTIFIFTSDNGGLLPITSNLGVRAGKGSAYEGGVRVPMIVLWPGVTKAGSVSATPVISWDYLPTLLEVAGAKSNNAAVEGTSLVPLLRGRELAPRPLFWHYPHYHPGGATPYSAVRDGEWKLIEFFEDHHAELYHLRDDPMESHDLAETEPAQTARLRADLEAWRKKVGAQLPSANPGYDPVKDQSGAKKVAKLARTLEHGID